MNYSKNRKDYKMDFDREFNRHARQVKTFILVGVVVKLAIVGGLIWLAVYAINAFSG